MQKKFYKCHCPIFRELYSGVFNPYSDVLKPYSGVFMQIFYESHCSILRESYSGVFRPYSDVLKPYSGVFLQIFFFSVTIPNSGGLIVAFLSLRALASEDAKAISKGILA